MVDLIPGNSVGRGKLEIGNGELSSEEDLTTRSDGSTESSSIGQPDDDDVTDDDDEDEVQSTLSSLASLEDSLPIKRGLSKYYGGKSKSYGNLGEVSNVNEIGKSENPFNKRRRSLMAYNLMFKSGSKQEKLMMNKKKKSGGLFYSHSNHISMPLLPLAEQDDDDNDDDNDGVVDDSSDADDYYTTTTASNVSVANVVSDVKDWHR